MMDEHFASGNSQLHRRNPKVKIIVAIAFITVVAVTNNFTVATVALIAAVLLISFAHLAPGSVAKRLLAVNSFIVFLWLTLPLTYGGEQTIRFGSIALSQEGIHIATLITLKANAIILALIALLGTSTIAHLGHALDSLGLSKRLCFLLLFSYRYIFVIHNEYKKLSRALKIRCFVPATNIHTYRTYGYLFGMTLVRSWNRASRVHQAMLLRGFNGQLIPLDTKTINRNDYFFLATSLLLTFVLAILPLF